MENTFQYQLFMDEGITGNFEVLMFKTAELAGEGEQVHSKKSTGKFPSADWDTSIGLIKAALENL